MADDNLLSSSGRFDKEALVALIDSRFTHNITGWYQTYLQPMHNENKGKLDNIQAIVTTIVSRLDRAEGAFTGGSAVAKSGMSLAEKILAAGGFVGAFVLGHFWK